MNLERQFLEPLLRNQKFNAYKTHIYSVKRELFDCSTSGISNKKKKTVFEHKHVGHAIGNIPFRDTCTTNIELNLLTGHDKINKQNLIFHHTWNAKRDDCFSDISIINKTSLTLSRILCHRQVCRYNASSAGHQFLTWHRIPPARTISRLSVPIGFDQRLQEQERQWTREAPYDTSRARHPRCYLRNGQPWFSSFTGECSWATETE